MPKDAKAGKGRRGNKTARVLSLLTDPDSAVEEKETDEAKPAAEAPEEKVRAASDENTQAQIRDALESELAAAPPRRRPVPPPPAPEPGLASAPEPEPQPEPELEPAPVAEAEPVPAPGPVPAPVAEPGPAPEPGPEPEPVSEETENYTCLNVTQALVEEKADKYMTMFGMCTCNRCRIDVIAMALSNLPAKYVVVKNEDINPRLSFYEQKYNAAVITAVMGACKRVLERPHHER